VFRTLPPPPGIPLPKGLPRAHLLSAGINPLLACVARKSHSHQYCLQRNHILFLSCCNLSKVSTFHLLPCLYPVAHSAGEPRSFCTWRR